MLNNMPMSIGLFRSLVLSSSAVFPLSLFANGENGFIFDMTDTTTTWQDVARTTPSDEIGEVVGYVDGLVNSEDAEQSTTSLKPTRGAVAIAFDGVDDHLTTALVPEATMTLAAKFSATTAATRKLIGGGTNVGNLRSYLSHTGTGRIGGGVGSQTDTTISGNNGSINGLTGVGVLTHNGTTVKVYWNGAEVYSAAQSGGIGTAPYYVGTWNNGGTPASFFNGTYYNALAINRVLTPEEITQLTDYWYSPLDGLSPTGAWSASRKLLTSYAGGFYTASGGLVSSFNDQTGNDRHLTQGTDANKPVPDTAGPNSVASLNMDGLSQLQGVAISNHIGASAGYIICSILAESIVNNFAPIYANHRVVGTAAGMGLFLHDTGDPKTISSYNNDGTEDFASSAAITEGTAYVLEWKHEAGNVSVRVNGGSWVDTASGDTADLTGLIRIGGTASTLEFKGHVFEIATWSTIPSTAQQTALVANFMDHIGI